MTPLVLALLLAAPPLTTVAEQSQFTRTGRYAEVLELCAAFPRRFPGKVRCETFGKTPEGRPMVALVASNDGVLEPKAAHKKGRPVVLFQGGIHAGEIDGKDAGFWLLRELLGQRGPLDQLTAVFVPVFNVDGHERFGKNNRPNQNGPEEMGWRVTAQNLNLNRDYAKADAPEMVAMLGLLARWDPIVYVDLHVTDGAEFQHEVAVMLEPANAGPPGLVAVGKAVHAELLARLSAKGHRPLPFYPSFELEDDPTSGFSLGLAPPRFSTTYWSLKNRFAVLVETHSWKPYATRVKATRETVLGLLELAARDGRTWLEAAQKADQDDERNPDVEVPLSYKNNGAHRDFEFQGYAYKKEPSWVSGKPWIRYDTSRPEVQKVPYRDQLEPASSARLPRHGYLVAPSCADRVAKKLQTHGLAFQWLEPGGEVAVQAFRASAVKFGEAPYEGRLTAQVTGAWSPEKVPLFGKALFVPAAQRGRRLLLHLFEPTGRDSFTAWGEFNAFFERKEYMEDYVAEGVARQMLAEDGGVAQGFRERLKDPAFAKSPSARLEYFHQKHPSWDTQLHRLPVFRLDAPVPPAPGPGGNKP